MSADLTKAAMRACIALSDALEALSECERIQSDTQADIRGDLHDAYILLTDRLSVELGCDAAQLVRDVMALELETTRAMLTAQTGIRFPIERGANMEAC